MVRNGLVAAAAVVFVIVASSPAYATHSIAIDGPTGSSSWQGLGDSCNPCTLTLNFSVNAGSGLTKQVNIYSNGLVSVGSDFSTVPTLTPGASPEISPNTSTNFFSLFYDPDIGNMFTDYVFTSTEDDIIFIDPYDAYQGFPTPVELQLTPNAGQNPGSFTAGWSYQTPTDFAGYPTSFNAVSGYSLNGGADSNLGFSNGDSMTFNYASTGTPEPAIWLELIVGFLGVGFVVRRRPSCAAVVA